MIVARMDGGLGNQMFQYAFGLYLASKHNARLVLDISAYDCQPAHGFLLDRFQIQATLADAAARRRYPSRRRAESAASWWEFVVGPRPLRHIRQRPFGFQPKFLLARDESYLDGYWQSELFFPGMRTTLLEHFQPCSTVSSASRRVQEEMLGTNSIAVHVRRGDYVSNPRNAQIYRQLDSEYYRACVDDWAKHRLAPRLFVFSNDLTWCRENLQFKLPTRFVEHSGEGTTHEDLWMMSSAACCVIANSTFSWWGAWLNNRADRIVYTPRKWFHPSKLDDRDIPSSDWICVDLREPSLETLAAVADSTENLAFTLVGQKAA